MNTVACHGAGDDWRIVSGSDDETVRVCDGAAGGAPLLKLEGHTRDVSAIACHGAGDGWRYVSGGRDRKLLVWDGVAGGAPLLTLEGHTDFVFAIACHGAGDGIDRQFFSKIWGRCCPNYEKN